GLGQSFVLAPQLALELLDAVPVLPSLLRAGAGLLGCGQSLRGALLPARQLLRVHAVGAAPSALARLIQRGSGHHRLETGRRCPSPLASGLGQRPPAPPFQSPNSNPPPTRHLFQRSTLRRQQPRHRSVLEALSVSCQLATSSLP